MVQGQGGDLDAPRLRATAHSVISHQDGYVSQIETDRLGLAIIEMGGGRKHMGDQIDHSVGIQFQVKMGDPIRRGDTIAEIYCPEKMAEHAVNLVSEALVTSPSPPELPPLVLARFE